MKLISSDETFDFRHDADTLVSVSPEPTVVSDAVAAHLSETFGGLVAIRELPEGEDGEVVEDSNVVTDTNDTVVGDDFVDGDVDADQQQ